MQQKRILTFAIILLAIIAIVLIGYNFGFKKEPTTGQEKTTTEKNQPAQSQPTTKEKIITIGDGKAFWPTLSQDDKKVIYFQANGNLFEADLNGENIKKKSSLSLAGLIKAIWSPENKDKIITVFNEKGLAKKYLYNYATGVSMGLSDNIRWINWSPDGQKMVYQYQTPTTDERPITISNPDGSKWKNIFSTRLNDLIVEWPTKDKVSIREKPSGLSQGFLYAINPNNGDFNKLISDFYGLSVKWSPKGNKILFSGTDNNGHQPTLSIADQNGEKIINLGIKTIADKCVWSSDEKNIYCAVPQQLSASAIWPDDYYKGKLIIKDDLLKIDAEKGQLNDTEEFKDYNFDMQDMFLSPKDDYLFFINRYDQTLFRIALAN